MKKAPFVWVDLETPGTAKRAPNSQILEIGVVVTTPDTLEVLDSYSAIIHASDEVLASMDPWCIDQHGKSGLTEACRASTISQAQAEQEALEVIKKHTTSRTSPLAGNSIYLDRSYLEHQMPTLNAWLSYRQEDVSTFKIEAQMNHPEIPIYQKGESHRAVDDIRESIGELAFYRQHLLKEPAVELPAEWDAAGV